MMGAEQNSFVSGAEIYHPQGNELGAATLLKHLEGADHGGLQPAPGQPVALVALADTDVGQ